MTLKARLLGVGIAVATMTALPPTASARSIDEISFVDVTEITVRTKAQEGHPISDAMSACLFRGTETHALAADTFFNPNMFAVDVELADGDIDVRADGLGLPPGNFSEGEKIFSEQCASCHGDFGEAVDRWPVLAGGHGTLKNERPEKTIGSYWPHTSTVYDYVRRAMPFGNARPLSTDDVYALTAYLLHLNNVVTDTEFELTDRNFTTIILPNAGNFIPDDRLQEKHYTTRVQPCMKDCKPKVKLLARAQVLDVTPDGNGGGGAAGVD
jgi:cytochrome c